jgi:hypothetical protein
MVESSYIKNILQDTPHVFWEKTDILVYVFVLRLRPRVHYYDTPLRLSPFSKSFPTIPAKAGIQLLTALLLYIIPAFNVSFQSRLESTFPTRHSQLDWESISFPRIPLYPLPVIARSAATQQSLSMSVENESLSSPTLSLPLKKGEGAAPLYHNGRVGGI